jgi:pimeloyl-ACP methyl ester carboxylesterase
VHARPSRCLPVGAVVASTSNEKVAAPLAVACIGVPVPCPLWQDQPSWFFVAEEDRMIPAETQRFMAERMKARVHTAAADHVPMITKASTVVDVLLEAVRAAAPKGKGEL